MGSPLLKIGPTESLSARLQDSKFVYGCQGLIAHGCAEVGGVVGRETGGIAAGERGRKPGRRLQGK